MQKPVAANKKAAKVITVLISHMSDYFFEKRYDKMKHVNYVLYQNTNTVILNETKF